MLNSNPVLEPCLALGTFLNLSFSFHFLKMEELNKIISKDTLAIISYNSFFRSRGHSLFPFLDTNKVNSVNVTLRAL